VRLLSHIIAACDEQQYAHGIHMCTYVTGMCAGGNAEMGQLIADAMAIVGHQGVVTMEESKTAADCMLTQLTCIPALQLGNLQVATRRSAS
jgi:hypothetical protein